VRGLQRHAVLGLGFTACRGVSTVRGGARLRSALRAQDEQGGEDEGDERAHGRANKLQRAPDGVHEQRNCEDRRQHGVCHRVEAPACAARGASAPECIRIAPGAAKPDWPGEHCLKLGLGLGSGLRAVQLPPEEQAAQRLAQRPHLHREDADDAEQEADAHDRVQQRARAGAHLRARRRRSRTARGHASQGRGAEASGRAGARMRLAKQGRKKASRVAGARKRLAGQGARGGGTSERTWLSVRSTSTSACTSSPKRAYLRAARSPLPSPAARAGGA